MAKQLFITRVELHDAKSSDYEKLHSAMRSRGFSQTITADNGVMYHLPPAEYYREGQPVTPIDTVLAAAKAAAASTGKLSSVLVTETYHTIKWDGLIPVQQQRRM